MKLLIKRLWEEVDTSGEDKEMEKEEEGVSGIALNGGGGCAGAVGSRR